MDIEALERTKSANLEMLFKLFSAYLQVFLDYFVQKAAVNLFGRVIWYHCSSAVRVPEKHMAPALLSWLLKPHPYQYFRKFLCLEQRQFFHCITFLSAGSLQTCLLYAGFWCIQDREK